MHSALWNRPLDSILCDISIDSAGTSKSFRYLPRMFLQQLQLEHLAFLEEVLLIREEYVTALQVMVSWSTVYKGGVVVTGYSGIGMLWSLTNIVLYTDTRPGKTHYLLYILVRRLCAGLPTALQFHSDKFFLFSETGASVLSVTSEIAFKLPRDTWALVDSTATIYQPCDAFLHSGAFIIQASSEASRWKEWLKQRRAKLYVMDYNSIDELEALGWVHC